MRKSLLLFFLFQTLFLDAQAQTEYTHDFKFKDGIYLTFEDFKNNRPKVLADGLTEHLDKLFKPQGGDARTICLNSRRPENPEIRNRNQEIKKLLPMDYWGICLDGIPYIRHELFFKEQCFFKVFSIGRISRYIISTRTEATVSTPRPTDAGPPAYSPTKVAFKHYAIDFTNGGILNVDKDFRKIVNLIKRDAYFVKTKIKRKEINLYITQYNQRNPIKFPK